MTRWMLHWYSSWGLQGYGGFVRYALRTFYDLLGHVGDIGLGA